MKLIAFHRQAATLAPKKIVKSLHRNTVLKDEKNISWNHFLKIIVVNFTNFWHIRKFNVNIKKMYFIFQHYSPLQLRVSNYCRCTCSNRINECNFTKKAAKKKKTGEQPKWRHFSCNRLIAPQTSEITRNRLMGILVPQIWNLWKLYELRFDEIF